MDGDNDQGALFNAYKQKGGGRPEENPLEASLEKPGVPDVAPKGTRYTKEERALLDAAFGADPFPNVRHFLTHSLTRFTCQLECWFACN